MKVNEVKNKIIDDLAQKDYIFGVGQTGDINAKMTAGFSDIDMFVLCSRIPTSEERITLYEKYSSEYSDLQMNACCGGLWGYGDILFIEGIDVMYMYFTIEEMENYVDEVLSGKHLNRKNGFYPTGRLASIETIHILYERNEVWTKLKEKVASKPAELFDKLFTFHLSNIINEEDLGRVQLRKEVLFYQTVLENALDHFLQALYALNHVYFPSRKRIETYIDSFYKKPEHSFDRLLQIIQKSVCFETIDESIKELKEITKELSEL